MTEQLIRRLYKLANAERWPLPLDVFERALRASAEAKCSGGRDVEKYCASLHLEDLALACACAVGNETAWEHFMLQQRPVLYRAADALDASGRARELADALYADLYGLRDRDGERQSLFRYFHGRSSLATWLRAVLAQRYVDHVRSTRRFEALPDEESAPPAAEPRTDLDRARFVELMQQALGAAVAGLPPRDRLRLGCYYAQELTLAETGRALGEHEATVSRQLARTRRAIRKDIEEYLRSQAGLTPDEVSRCFESTAADAGPIDLGRMLRQAIERKIPEP